MRRATAPCGRTPARAILALTAGLLLTVAGWRVPACSTPVYQYALENWPPDAYALQVASNDPAAPGLQASCEGVLSGTGTAAVNAALRFSEDATLPAGEIRLTVRSPAPAGGREPVWTGPLTLERLRWITDSPVRAQLAEELVRGAAAVFLFLPAGDAAADTAARARLQAALAEMARTLTLPPPDPDTPATEPAAAPAPLRFPILDIPPQDPAEGFLRAILMASEPDLAGLREPMAFPVFGRGRALYAVVGAGINRDVLAEACAFLTGACSCQVKAQNPGVDLLLRADWEKVAGQSAPSFTELPPLTGLDAPAAANPATPTAVPAARPPPVATTAPPRFARRTLMVAAAALVAVLAGTAILLAATRSRQP
jgi:hypothetical protein